jgi:anthranilate synthase component I
MNRLEPTYEQFAAAARPGVVIPLARELLADALSPVVAYATIADEGEATFLLESVIGGEKWGRYSIVGFEPEVIARGAGDRFELLHPDGRLEVRTLPDPWTGLREVLRGYRPALAAGMPRFWGGAVGYVGYDAVRRFEPTIGTRALPEDSYDFSFAVGGTLIIFDSLRQTLRIVVACRIDEGDDPRTAYARGSERIDRAVQWLRSPARPHSLPPPRNDTEVPIPASTFDRAAYCAAVERCKEYIAAGDIFQVVLSQRFSVPKEDVDTFDVYRAMRVINPSPYMYFLRFGDLRIAGASPETLVRVEGGRAEVRPIAGTRPRGKSPEEDARIEREMFDDPKEIAEHVMLVDLGRNDLGRISVPGTVRLTERMISERFSHVMHITSNVEGRLAPGRDALDVLRATFPAGTLSGAPKVRAMQIIEELEPEPRGIYGGAIGYIGWDGNMDVAISIRTVVDRDGQLRVQAGAGIVEASQPASEYDECVNKARAALVAIASARRATGRV